MARVLAFDFGASSGRAILGNYSKGALSYQEVHRFENIPVTIDGRLCWDFAAIMDNVHFAISKAGSFDSLSFDTWGVDFGLLGADGKLLQNPVHYRDGRTLGVVKQAETILCAEKLYAATGNQIMQLNTLFQLIAMQNSQPDMLEKAKKLIFMPDLFAYMLSGSTCCEKTIASTSQMLNPVTADWSNEVLKAFKISEELLQTPVESGTVIGRYQGAKVIAGAGHDTQCAIAAMPVTSENAAFLSCGTWSLLGCELDAPNLTQTSQLLGLSNELGANGKINYLKNIIGLWLIQESRREYKRQGQEFSYAQLEQLALAAPAFKCFIDPDSSDFAAPGDLPARISDYCKRTKQYVPTQTGEIIRCIYESLALKYRYAICQLQDATNKVFSELHVLGGGTKDILLCQMTADCCRIPVKAGPIEATALGNIIIQLVALGELPDIEAGRRLICNTEKLKIYTPQINFDIDEAYKRFVNIINF